MAITLTITADGANELNEQLKGLVAAVELQTKVEIKSLPRNPEVKDEAKPIKKKEIAKKEKPVVKEEAVAEVAVSPEDLRAKAMELKKVKGAPAVKAVLANFGVVKITEVPTESQAEFYSALEGALNE